MGSGIYSALSGGLARMQQLESAVHDLANADKTAYKAGGMAFESLVDGGLQNQRAEGMNFCRTADRFIDFSQGALEHTGRSLDLAIEGEGFFKVAADEGFFYTRAGDFKLDADGNLVTSSGDLQVVGENGPINLPHHDVTIDAKGRIISDEDGQVGKIDIYRVDDMQGLAQRPDGLYEAAEGTEDEPEEDGARLVQGCLEKSNASPVELATGLIDIQRAYQAYLNTMKTYSEIGEQAARIGRVG